LVKAKQVYLSITPTFGLSKRIESDTVLTCISKKLNPILHGRRRYLCHPYCFSLITAKKNLFCLGRTWLC